MAENNKIARRSLLKSLAAIPLVNFVPESSEAKNVSVREYPWSRVKNIKGNVLYVDARVVNQEGRKSPLPKEVKRENLLQAEYDDKAEMFLHPTQENLLNENLAKFDYVVTVCEQGVRSLALAKEISKMASKITNLKLKAIVSLDGGLASILGEDRTAEAIVDSRAERN